jgi:WhiB family redox-sensing transcriptional regulator
MSQYKIEIDYDKAACTTAKDPDVFWPGNDKGTAAKVAEAKAICASCPEKFACLNHALQYEPEGIWGETTPTERNALRRSLNIVLTPIEYSNK